MIFKPQPDICKTICVQYISYLIHLKSTEFTLPSRNMLEVLHCISLRDLCLTFCRTVKGFLPISQVTDFSQRTSEKGKDTKVFQGLGKNR